MQKIMASSEDKMTNREIVTMLQETEADIDGVMDYKGIKVVL